MMRYVLVAVLLGASGSLFAAETSTLPGPAAPAQEERNWRMSLWAMTAPRHHWSTALPDEAPAAPPPQDAGMPARPLSNQERAALRKALEIDTRCMTGRVVYDPASGFFVPEFRRGCLPLDPASKERP